MYYPVGLLKFAAVCPDTVLTLTLTLTLNATQVLPSQEEMRMLESGRVQDRAFLITGTCSIMQQERGWLSYSKH